MSTTPFDTVRPGLSIGDLLRALRSGFVELDQRLEARRRARADSLALAEMSDRALHDIGLDRGFVCAVARGRWTRDWHHD